MHVLLIEIAKMLDDHIERNGVADCGVVKVTLNRPVLDEEAHRVVVRFVALRRRGQNLSSFVAVAI